MAWLPSAHCADLRAELRQNCEEIATEVRAAHHRRRVRDHVADRRPDGLRHLRRLVLARPRLLGRAREVRVVLRRLLPAESVEVLPRVDRVAAAAPVGGGVARDDLLRSERLERAVREEVVRLELLRRRERPAAAALPLVLDRGARARGAPVDRRRVRRVARHGVELLRQLRRRRRQPGVLRLELRRREVGEFGDAVLLLADGVPRVDGGERILEDREARDRLLLRAVRRAATVLADEALKLRELRVGGDVRGGGEREADEGEHILYGLRNARSAEGCESFGGTPFYAGLDHMVGTLCAGGGLHR